MPVPDAPYSEPGSINADFSQSVIVDTDTLPWLPSPQAGVERRLLDRVGAEVARATSIVRYKPGSVFPTHQHGGGEEFLVLEGVFCDEQGEYPVATYVRNPPGSSHAPFTRLGCRIFVKLRQMQPQGEPPVVCDSSALSWTNCPWPGVSEKILFDADHGLERVSLEKLEAGARMPDELQGKGYELLVLEGTVEINRVNFGPNTWLRTPRHQPFRFRAVTDCVYWVKRGHLNRSQLNHE